MDLSEFDIDFLSQKVSDNPQSPLFARLADLYLSKNQSAEALKLCEAGVQIFPSYAAGYVVLGKCYLALNENSKARLAFTQAIHFAPFNQLARKLLDEIPAGSEEPAPAPAPAEPEAAATPEPVQAEAEVAQEAQFAESSPAGIPVPEEAIQPMEAPPVPVEPAPMVDDIPTQHVFENTPAEPQPAPEQPAEFPGIDEYIQQRSDAMASEKLMSLDDYLRGAEAPAVTPPPVPVAPAAPPSELDTLAQKLESAARIVPPEPEPKSAPAESSPLDSTVITPTLAEIYASQGEYGAAIQAYEILLISKPGERERFEKRIKELQAKLFEGG